MIKRVARALAAASVFAAMALGMGTQTANAVPGQCGSGGFLGTGGGFCDGPAWPDGSWYHCVQVTVFGIGGGGCGQVCPNPNPALAPIPTDSDPATPC